MLSEVSVRFKYEQVADLYGFDKSSRKLITMAWYLLPSENTAPTCFLLIML